ncbi:hypothetical protein H7U31_02305 [Olsenella uli]|nr:hypothetical protein [Olsenella uli]
MLDKLKLLYPGISDELLSFLLENAQSFVCDYCNLQEYDEALDATLLRILQEDITKLDAQGMSGESAGGVSISYTSDYSPSVYASLNRHKRIKTIG